MLLPPWLLPALCTLTPLAKSPSGQPSKQNVAPFSPDGAVSPLYPSCLYNTIACHSSCYAIACACSAVACLAAAVAYTPSSIRPVTSTAGIIYAAAIVSPTTADTLATSTTTLLLTGVCPYCDQNCRIANSRSALLVQ